MSIDELFVAQVVAALAKVKLEAIIVGATAAALHGAPLTTLDVDLLVRDTPRNRQKIDAFGEALGGGRPMVLHGLESVLTVAGLQVPVDIILETISGNLSFASVRSRSVNIPIGEHTAIVASLEDVIRSKEAANRPKDLAALPILRDTLRVKNALAETE